MSDDATVDYDALAKQYGATSSAVPQVDYDALAKQNGAISSAQRPAPSLWERIRAKVVGSPDQVAAMKSAASQTPAGIVSAEWNPGSKTIQAETRPIETAARQVGQGQYAGAAHTVVSNVGQAMTPLAVPFAAASPFAFLTSLALGAVGQYGFSKSAKALGASPDQSALAGDVGGFVGGYAGYKGANAVNSLVGSMRGVVSQLTSEEAATAPPAGKLQPALNNTPTEVLNYAQQKGIDLTRGEGLQTPLARTAQAEGERSLVQGNPIGQARQLNHAKFAKNVQDFAQRSDPYGLGISEEDAGRAIQQSIRVGQNISHENASAAYKALPQELLDAKVNVSNINSQYFQAMKNAETSLSNRNPQMAAQIRQVYEQFSNLGTPTETATGAPYKKPEVDFQTLLKMRSDAIQDGDVLAHNGAPNEVQGMYRKVAQQLDSLAESTANKFGVADQWREANAGWREYQTKYNSPQTPFSQLLGQSDPAKVTRSILNRGSASDIETMKSENMNAAVEAIRRQVITDIANRGFRVQGDGLGGYSDNFLNSLFGPKGTKELYLNGDLARRMKFELNPSGTSNVVVGLEQATNPRALIASTIFGKAAMPHPAASYLPSRYSLPPQNPIGSLMGVASLRSLLGSRD